RDAVRVVEARCTHRLAAEPRDHAGVGAQLLVEDLDGDGTAERDLVRLVDGSRPADPDAGGQLELVAEHPANKLQGLLDLVLHRHVTLERSFGFRMITVGLGTVTFAPEPRRCPDRRRCTSTRVRIGSTAAGARSSTSARGALPRRQAGAP